VPRAEERRAETNFGRAFLDGDFEIVAHSHRKDWQRMSYAATQIVAQFAELAEIGTRALGIVEIRRDGHQTAQF
jgi:hypothetical protein